MDETTDNASGGARETRDSVPLRSRVIHVFETGGDYAWDQFQRFLFNYGVPSFRLIRWSVILFVVSVLILTLPGGLAPKEKKLNINVGKSSIVILPEPEGRLEPPKEPWHRVTKNLIPGTQLSFATFAAVSSYVIYTLITIAIAGLLGAVKRR